MKNKLDELNKRLHIKGSTEGKKFTEKESDKFGLQFSKVKRLFTYFVV